MHRENIRYHTLYQQHRWCNGQRARLEWVRVTVGSTKRLKLVFAASLLRTLL